MSEQSFICSRCGSKNVSWSYDPSGDESRELICNSCNISKSMKDLQDYIRSLEDLIVFYKEKLKQANEGLIF